jgi:hypothetical protein
MLNRHHSAGAEAQAVAAAIDFVENRNFGITGAQKIGVQRVTLTTLDGARRRDQRLAENLASEDPLPAVLRRNAAKSIGFYGLVVEQPNKLTKRLRRAPFVRRSIGTHRLSLETTWQRRKRC